MSEKPVSIIIPVKEKNKYLDELLLDIDNQSYSDVEILVEEGGGSASAGRNNGLKKARGQYVIFCDADDRVSPTYVESLVKAIESKPDAVMGIAAYDVCDPIADGDDAANRWDVIKTCAGEKAVMTGEDMLFRLFDTKIYQGYIWNKIFKKSLIDKCGLKFSEDIRFNEDRLFIFNYLLMNDGVVTYRDDVCYHYMHRADSVMGQIRDHDIVTDEMTTEFLAFDMMIEQLLALIFDSFSGGGRFNEETIRRLMDDIRQDEIQSELRLFKKMVSRRDIFRYRKSAMRSFAKSCPANIYIPRGDMEDVLLRIFKRYALTGCTYTSHPEYFGGVGIL